MQTSFIPVFDPASSQSAAISELFMLTLVVLAGMAMPGSTTKPSWVTIWPWGESEKLPARVKASVPSACWMRK